MKPTSELAVVEPQAVVIPERETPQAFQPAPITAAQGKVDAIANLTFKAYEKASSLILADSEIEALQADFPDDAFRRGAGGDNNLIYIEHAHLRDRLNKVFKAGQWAIVPRNRWAEEYTTGDGKPAVRVYVEAMLLIRGCFVAEAVGDMTYYPNNAKTNYGDAVEGAKSSCLRRCAKELGIGLQAWKKEWCEGWKSRNSLNGPAQAPGKPASEPQRREPAKTPPPAAKRVEATPKMRDVMLTRLVQAGVKAVEITKYAVDRAIILPNEDVTQDWPLEKVPTSAEEMAELIKKVKAFVSQTDDVPQ